MATCVAPNASIQLPPINYSLRTTSNMSSSSCRKRLLSEQNDDFNSPAKCYHHDDEINKRTKTDLFPHESKNKYQHHEMQSTTACFFESIRVCRSAPGLLRRKSLTHAPFTYIKNVPSSEQHTFFLPSLSKTSLEKNMLVCQQTPVILNKNESEDEISSIFLSAAYMIAMLNNTNQKILIIDCGSPLRHTERRIQNSVLLNVNDKISRKRLSTRGLKNFLDKTHLNRLDQNEIIILYDDSNRSSSSLCAKSLLPIQLSSGIKCVYDEIKRYDTNKIVHVLQSSFDEFYQHYPSLCYISTSTDEDISSSMTEETIDIESFQMSQVLPGLFLGNSHDAEDLNLLKQNHIQSIINVSTSIPCYFENEKHFDYLRLPCHDSSNQNIVQYFDTTLEYIHEKLSNHKNILVHCQGGVSRSPSFIIGYLMKYHSKTFDEAHQIIKNKRCIINPNLNFLGQLIQYQQILNSA